MIPKHAWSALLAYDDDERFSCFELPSDVRQTIIQQCPWITLKQLETLYRPADPEVFGPKPTQQGLIKLEKRYELDPMHNCYQHKWQYVHEFEDFWNNEIFIFRPTAERMRQLGLHESQFPSFTSFDNHTAPGETVKKGVGPGEAPPSEGDKKLCEYSVFKVSCDHKARQFKLDSAQDKPNDGSRYVYQVLAKAEEPDRIHIQYQGQCHGRDYAHPDCGGFKVTGPNMTHKDQDGNTFKVYAPKDKGCDDFATFLKLFLLPNSQAATYTAKPISCYNHGDAYPVTIQAFSTVSWQSDLSLGCNIDDKRQVGWEIAGQVGIQANQNHYQLKANTTPMGPLFQKTREFLEHVLPFFGVLDRFNKRMGSGSIEVKLPQVHLKGNLKNTENPTDYNVGYQGELNLQLDPLFGLHGETDIIEWVLNCFPETRAAALLNHIIDKQSKTNHLNIGITLSAGSEIQGNLQWAKNIKDRDWQTQGEVNAAVPVKIEGDVHAQATFFIFRAAAGASFEVKSSVDIKAIPNTHNDGLTIKPQFEFNGLTLHWACYAEFSANKPSKHGQRSLAKKDDRGALKGKSVHEEVLIEPKTWPDNPKPLHLTQGIL